MLFYRGKAAIGPVGEPKVVSDHLNVLQFGDTRDLEKEESGEFNLQQGDHRPGQRAAVGPDICNKNHQNTFVFEVSK